ncbi:DsrE family protein [Mangrovibacterium lignilyticum]|uniref:DsrE family protein n=1 Tax=Mangrovibacterium lignilyticum TaxID=2668052 RepID=UPI001EE528F9|nr:DsrE family protein [Mangrovibacterium lignilyticum]
MRKLLLILLILTGTSFLLKAQNTTKMNENNNKLAVIWSSGDPEVAKKVCFMYTLNAKKQGWFEDVVLIVWGPSAKLLSEDEDLQADVQKMMDAGVVVEACISCAKLYGVDQDLEDLNIDVRPMGVPLTNYLKEGWHTLNF